MEMTMPGTTHQGANATVSQPMLPSLRPMPRLAFHILNDLVATWDFWMMEDDWEPDGRVVSFNLSPHDEQGLRFFECLVPNQGLVRLPEAYDHGTFRKDRFWRLTDFRDAERQYITWSISTSIGIGPADDVSVVFELWNETNHSLHEPPIVLPHVLDEAHWTRESTLILTDLLHHAEEALGVTSDDEESSS